MSRILILLICLIFSFNSWAEASSETKQSLKKVTANISQTQTDLKRAEENRKKLLQQLQSSESNIGNISLQLKQINQQLQKQEKNLSDLTQKKSTLVEQLNSEQESAAKAVSNAYQMGQLQTLKILLNQQNPAEFSRMFGYYQYILKARHQILQNIQATMAELNQTKTAIESTQADLLKQKQNLEASQNQWNQQRDQRKKIVTQLDQTIASNQQKLSQLTEERNHLSNTIDQLQKAALAKPFKPSKPSKISGKYYWPTQGRIVSDFGDTIEDSELRANGVVISAPQGQNIYAIAAGKVVYSAWMAGYGLLLIIDHGNGYMTIYGRNNAVFVKKGQVVNAGQTIASVGDSGGFNQPGLYFAVRYNGKPLNPAGMCQPLRNGYTPSFS